MNQGNVRSFEKDDVVWQEGGVIFHFKETNKWEAVFLAYQSQSWCTDNETSHYFS